MKLRKVIAKKGLSLSFTAISVFSLFTVSYLVKNLSTQNTRVLTKADSQIIYSDNFSNLSAWTTTGTNSSLGQVASPNFQIAGKTAVKLAKTTSDAICLTKTITPSSDIRVKVQFYDDFNPQSPASSATTGSFISLRNSTSPVLAQVTVGVRGGKYLQTIANSPTDFYFLRIGNNSYPSGSGVDPDSNSFIVRTPGWHTLELVNTPLSSYVEIDGINTSYLPVFNGVSKGFTGRVGMADQILMCNVWTNGTGYFSNLTISTPSVPAYDQTLALFNPITNYLAKYPPYTSSQIKQMSVGPFKDWYTPDGLCRMSADDAASSALIWKKTSNTTYRDRAISSLTTVLDTDICYPYWQAGITAYNATTFPVQLAVWYIWNDLSPQLKQKATSLIANELNYFSTFDPASRWNYDSAAEENSWIAQDLWFGAMLFPNHQNAELWRNKSDVYAYHSLSTNESYAGLTTQTLQPGNYVINHGNRNNAYQLLTLGQLGNAYLLSDRLGTNRPSNTTFMHNVSSVWTALRPSMDSAVLSYTDNPSGTWTLAANRGNKDEHGLDPYYEINALLFLQKYNFSTSIFDDTLKKGWYTYNDFTVMPAGGTNCMEYADINTCVWRYPFLIDPDTHISINEFRRRVYNAVAAGERFSFAAAVTDMSLSLPKVLDYKPAYYLPPAISSGTSQPTSDKINKFISATGINNYRSFHFEPHSSVDILSWQDSLSDNKTMRIFYFDDSKKNIGMNLGWQNASKSLGLSFQVKSLNDPVTLCNKSYLKASFSTQCYVVRISGQAPANEQSTKLARTTGWHYIDFSNNSGTYSMSVDGVKIYSTTSTDPLNTFFITSSNWSTPTTSDYILTKI